MIDILKIRGVIFDWGRTLFDNETGDFFPEAHEVILSFKKRWRLAIASVVGEKKEGERGISSIYERVRLLDMSGLTVFFDFSLFTHDENGKPSFFRKISDRWEVAPENILVIDDRMVRLAWAIQNGFQTVWLMRGKFAEEFPDDETGNPGLVITSLTELKELFEESWRRT
jgi:FMN phosphatase YigB (HAD superfamily)